ncbi:MAG TPA: adenylosuccinate lyase, partial [Bdellovibrionota bacterium]|nr:adenylosuccinate lyase [Bdellovibrionota bacterium]
MISRYTRQVMADLWSAEHRFQVWLRVETLAAEAMAKEGIVPAKAAKTIKEKARFSVQRIEEIEKTVKHDVIAFISNVAESIGDAAPYLHYGMTSSDVLDTSLGCLLKEASEILLGDLRELKSVLKDLAERHKMTVMIGRTHGMHAEPITFGLKCALWYAETDRNISRLREARKRIAVGKLSGAVGTYAHLPPSIEAYVCRELGLTPALVATQVIQRDRHAEFFSSLAVIGSTLEKIATEIRHLQRPEIGEVEEEFTAGQKGSSAMPHK